MRMIVAALSWSWRETEVDPLTGAIRANRRDRGPSGAELAALEHALRLAERWDARVVAASVAPAEADEMLRDALAAGASQALRVEVASSAASPRPAGLVGGEQESAAALAAALRQHYGVPNLVLCGDLAADRATGSFPAFLAASLSAEQALGCVRLEPVDDRTLRVHRRLDGGRREVLMVRPPAVVSVEAAGVRLRRAGLPATLATASTPITVASMPAAAPRRIRVLGAHPYRPRPRELPEPTGTALRRTLELTGALVPRTPPTVLGPLSPGQAADELLGYLRRHGYLAENDQGSASAGPMPRTERRKPAAPYEMGLRDDTPSTLAGGA
jgi:electron transfer flavoprotein beta subunit